MNIFVTSPSPVLSAQALDDKRLVKMCLETAQILCSCPWPQRPEVYKPTHENHPVVKWAGATGENYKWTEQHFVALCAEYNKRYSKIHGCMDKLVTELGPDAWGDNAKPDGFCNAAANQGLKADFRRIPDVFKAYSAYLLFRWCTDKTEPTWNKQKVPQITAQRRNQEYVKIRATR